MTPCSDLKKQMPLTLTPPVEEHYDTTGLLKGSQWAAHAIFPGFAHLVVLMLQDSSTSNGTDTCKQALRPQQRFGLAHHACIGQVAQCAKLVVTAMHLQEAQTAQPNNHICAIKQLKQQQGDICQAAATSFV